jgi:hypothetical protein
MTKQEEQAAISKWLESHQVEKLPPGRAHMGVGRWYGGVDNPLARVGSAVATIQGSWSTFARHNMGAP